MRWPDKEGNWAIGRNGTIHIYSSVSWRAMELTLFVNSQLADGLKKAIMMQLEDMFREYGGGFALVGRVKEGPPDAAGGRIPGGKGKGKSKDKGRGKGKYKQG